MEHSGSIFHPRSRSRSPSNYSSLPNIDLAAVSIDFSELETSFSLDGSSREWGRHAQHLLKTIGCCRLLSVLPGSLAGALRQEILGRLETSEDVGEDVYVHEPRCRRHVLLSLDEPILAQACHRCLDALRPVLEPLLGNDATLVELAALVSKDQARAQHVHRDVHVTEGASNVVIVQMVLQDTTIGMGPLVVEPRTHLSSASESQGEQLALPSPVGTLLLFDARIRHFGGAHIGGPDRVIAYFTLMQDKRMGRPVACGSTWALSPALWGRRSFGSLSLDIGSDRVKVPSVDHWTFKIGELGCPLLQVAGILGDLKALRCFLPESEHNHAHIIDDKGLLHAASKCGRCSIASYLLSHRACINLADSLGHQPLHLAAEGGHSDVVMTLIKHRANILAEDASAKGGHAQAIHLAAWKGHTAVLRILLSHSADANAQDFHGAYPLHRAALSGHGEAVTLLLSIMDRTVSMVDHFGRFPIHVASAVGHAMVVGALLEAVQNNGLFGGLHAFDHKGLTPFSWAVSRNHRDVLQVFSQYGFDEVKYLPSKSTLRNSQEPSVRYQERQW